MTEHSAKLNGHPRQTVCRRPTHFWSRLWGTSLRPLLPTFGWANSTSIRTKWARAANCFDKSLALREDSDQAHLLLGLATRELRQPEHAEKEFARAASLNPRSDVNAYFAGQQLLLDMKFEAALAYLYQAVKLNPRNVLAYRALGMTQVHLGNYGLAESYYRKAIDDPR